eukprot:CAMPEP_0194574854 /NCGR_PEP_ID=MMETSP0292-20121207/10550_1 /TAXON_ID=39354 /ORGANISM="Heterosigma akashiwo, Strain CCMP2393" /LENGTH=45 /DNA_ID= /DNA_START= /DNA_END= /DNA_ORIENTATION=
MPEVDVEQVPGRGHHDVVRVAVPDAQHVGRDAVAGARADEVVLGV